MEPSSSPNPGLPTDPSKPHQNQDWTRTAAGLKEDAKPFPEDRNQFHAEVFLAIKRPVPAFHLLLGRRHQRAGGSGPGSPAGRKPGSVFRLFNETDLYLFAGGSVQPTEFCCGFQESEAAAGFPSAPWGHASWHGSPPCAPASPCCLLLPAEDVPSTSPEEGSKPTWPTRQTTWGPQMDRNAS